jgi:hypothetical protein
MPVEQVKKSLLFGQKGTKPAHQHWSKSIVLEAVEQPVTGLS